MRTKQELLDYLKHVGERITMPRLAVIEALYELGGHQTTQTIQQYFDEKGISIQEPTIYRVLQRLKDLEIVSQTDLGQSGITYELLSTPHHHHLVCLECGQIQDFDDAAVVLLREHLRQTYDFEPRIDHLAIFGVCQHCRNDRSSEHDVVGAAYQIPGNKR